ncbi:MAG: carboxypeptidase regulatory-like domain-containing protein, partial [Bryobacterales bacterium]|nr:carboxypeptidase regulatory-like domain-containing protein [Bryobacterales bacterium]
MPAIFLALLLTLSAFAQSSAGGGSIQGTVKDPTGAVLPGAKITIRHLESGRATTTVANAEGFFATPPLNIGAYKVRVEMTGMKAWESDLTLETGRIAAIEPV